MELLVDTTSYREAAIAEDAALSEIDRLTGILSTYRHDTEIKRIERSGGPCSPDLANVLSAYRHWEGRTEGAISLVAAKNGWNVDALGKAYILESAKNAVVRAAPTLRGLLLNIGGDIVASGDTPWRIAIADPLQPHENASPLTDVVLRNQAVATSGISERGRHIVDPRTGTAVRGVTSATVIAPDAITANALSTALCVVQPEQGRAIVESTTGAHGMIVAEGGRVFRSSGFAGYEQAPRMKKVFAAAWPAGYEVSIQLNLKTVQMMRVRRPYVAVWAEDANGNLVRNIEVWANKQKYLPDLDEWWKINGRSYSTISISKPTRDPGRYRLVWNGLDDRGRPVAAGTYQIFVETNREHGNYYKRSTSILCGPKPSSASLPETPEFEPVAIEYGPRGSAA